MIKLKSSFLQEANARGFIHQCTNLNKIDDLMDKKKIVAYLGFDPTAGSLHIGNLVLIMFARLLQKHGHVPIVLLGGGTAMVGDPSGKDKQRKVLAGNQVVSNTSAIKETFSKYINFDTSENKALIVNNCDWLSDLNYLDFLQNYGRHFSVNRMLSFDIVKSRLDKEQSISFLEFNYMVLQAYDFLKLHREFDCVLQLGGSDQWGNIVNGVELIRRVNGKEVFGLTTPLITKSDGKKMGKSASGAVWLNKNSLITFEFWQFWRNVSDTDVGRFLRLYTDLSIDEIEKLEKLKGTGINAAKIILANEVTGLCHGKDAVKQANDTAKSLFKDSNEDSEIKNLPTLKVNLEELKEGICLKDALVRVGLVNSKGEAKRLIKSRAIKLNNNVVSDINYILGANDLVNNSHIQVSLGKKKYAMIQVASVK